MRIGVGIGIGMSSAPPSAPAYSAEYQAILTAGSAYTQPSSTEKSLQNQLILDLKSAGIWAKLDAFYMFANNITDSTGAFARINWKNPTANYGIAGPSGFLPSISAKAGFTGNGSNQSVNLQIQHASGPNFSNPNGSCGVLVGTTPNNNSAVLSTISQIGGANPSRIRDTSTSSIVGSVITTNYNDNQMVHINRKGLPGFQTIQAFIDGVSAGTSPTPTTWLTTDTTNWHLLYNGASYGSTQIKLAFIGGDLSTEASTFNSLISTYITAVNNLV